ncbi:hypothetical protein M407DRAFT_31720 [Tulasnella calospora MUT 4182]|uniref:Uncharacterized protein n=1 Tax=Tulasnella calospora MUT 4182 TaxID=1051891 RepID=A0A0C3Q576_9AGAM|nr:hypothetical protein M407DRAFT_31720 [Tulasnella calospora MUT 4182]
MSDDDARLDLAKKTDFSGGSGDWCITPAVPGAWRMARELKQEEWERVTGKVGSWIWAYKADLVPFSRSATAEQLRQLGVEHRKIARAHALFKLAGEFQ